MKNIVITGGTGCLGYHIIRLLLVEKEKLHVTVLHRKTSNTKMFDGVEVTLKEVNLYNIESVRDAIAEDADTIFHCAGNVAHYPDPHQWADNVLATRNVAVISLERHAKLVHVSTGATLPYQALANSRTLEKIPSGYVRTKRLAELEVLKLVLQGLDAVVVNPIIVVGQYDFHGNYSRFFRMKDLSFALPGQLEFCDAEYVAQGIIQAALHGKRGQHYVLGGQFLSWFDFFKIVADITGAKPLRWVAPKTLLYAKAYTELVWYYLSGTVPGVTPELVWLLGGNEPVPIDEHIKALDVLGYDKNRVNIRETCEKTYAWMQEQGNRLAPSVAITPN